MAILASNGKVYDLNALTESDRHIMIQLGHLSAKDASLEATHSVETTQEVVALSEATHSVETTQEVVALSEATHSVKTTKKHESTRL